ncbi:hypothetical protein KTO58_14710 [Chitinophaga pendula]|uniref:hypothetical protein n=1 Tax=Chitinophaga TaxID=79328 RepID=UPI0012FD79FF|nr:MULTISPECIES: hypothetical protein [Chitinophaga]UCJ04952.1 hypothetical protein KTO58_14710 [Chitinophaga pendula]
MKKQSWMKNIEPLNRSQLSRLKGGGQNTALPFCFRYDCIHSDTCSGRFCHCDELARCAQGPGVPIDL